MDYAKPAADSLTDLSVLFNAESGAVLSAGQPETISLSELMNNIKKETQNWITFAKLWEYTEAEDLSFAAWEAGQQVRFAYIEHDINASSKNPNANNSFAELLKQNGINYVVANYGKYALAAFVMGAVASINYDIPNGKITLAYKQQSGQEITCDNDDDYDILTGKGYNVYERDATANDTFTGYQRGTISGDYGFLDTFVNHVWINDSLQVALRQLLADNNFIPYNNHGLAAIQNAIQPVVDTAKAAGVINSEVELSSDIINAVVSETGITDIENTLYAQGWYLYARNPNSAARARRESPILRFYYCDGGSIQKIDLLSTVIR
jgi:predicted Fe-Mo cluster-binding NifX family protein